ncbi:hypothetical protein [Caulobacter segnis]|uniref:hypothetical protein n=1 Tax=Caulobacter segnis TaxID=88688 RepID=UPI001CBC5601|nr:hypothetical protein [Caulobacter segnis]UAL11532.1 hypothetical protein K8940_04355 [Caulobacter segnis]
MHRLRCGLQAAVQFGTGPDDWAWLAGGGLGAFSGAPGAGAASAPEPAKASTVESAISPARAARK